MVGSFRRFIWVLFVLKFELFYLTELGRSGFDMLCQPSGFDFAFLVTFLISGTIISRMHLGSSLFF